jgi:hypothetical protein
MPSSCRAAEQTQRSVRIICRRSSSCTCSLCVCQLEGTSLHPALVRYSCYLRIMYAAVFELLVLFALVYCAACALLLSELQASGRRLQLLCECAMSNVYMLVCCSRRLLGCAFGTGSCNSCLLCTSQACLNTAEAVLCYSSCRNTLPACLISRAVQMVLPGSQAKLV